MDNIKSAAIVAMFLISGLIWIMAAGLALMIRFWEGE